jgi:hypothetical protein
MKFGKHPKRFDARTLQLSNYLAVDQLPPAPVASANLERVYTATGVGDPSVLFPMDGNDTLGDCTIAALAHLATMAYAFVGQKVIPAQSDVEALYFQLTGGQDTGLDMLTVLNYIRQNEWLGNKPILGFAELNLQNKYLIRQAINLFGFTYTGFVVQANCVEEFNAGGPWVKQPLTEDGHCVVFADYDTTTGWIKPLTWGNVTTATWPWEQECVDEAYVLLPQEAATPGYIPGFNSEQLMADLALVTA